MIGKILGKTVRIVNAPVVAAEAVATKVIEEMTGGPSGNDPPKVASLPLDELAKALEEIDND